MKIDIGIKAADRKQIANGLAHLLADTYTLYLKTHNFHWNVTGPMFNALHAMFMVQYNELWLSLDEIAERIRALDEFAPGSGKQYAKLVTGHETCARTAREAFRRADEANDQPTADLATTRMQAHEKTAWMLRSLLQ